MDFVLSGMSQMSHSAVGGCDWQKKGSVELQKPFYVAKGLHAPELSKSLIKTEMQPSKAVQLQYRLPEPWAGPSTVQLP